MALVSQQEAESRGLETICSGTGQEEALAGRVHSALHSPGKRQSLWRGARLPAEVHTRRGGVRSPSSRFLSRGAAAWCHSGRGVPEEGAVRSVALRPERRSVGARGAPARRFPGLCLLPPLHTAGSTALGPGWEPRAAPALRDGR